MKQIIITYCDVCSKGLTKKQTQRHHLIPRLLRSTAKDELLKVNVCNSCHVAFHQWCNFADVVGKNKTWFKRRYYTFKREYLNIRNDFIRFQKGKKNGEKM